LDQILCQSPLPYPPVAAQIKSPAYAQAMLSNMSGSVSEMCAVSLYFYNRLLSQEQQKIADIFSKMAVVEMHHLEIFGTLAHQMGADPRLWQRRAGRMLYWSPGYNDYPQELLPILQNSLKCEQLTIQKYQDQAEEISDENVVENLMRIILDEQVHASILKELIEQHS
jgi:bacterioferritin